MSAEKFLNCPLCGEGGKRWLHDAQHCEFCGYSGIKAAFKPMVKPVSAPEPHEFQADGPGVIGSDLCQVCGKEQYEHVGELPSLKQMCVLMNLQREAAGYHDLKSKWDAAINEAHCCDDINLDQPLAGIIADLQKDRERLHAATRENWALYEECSRQERIAREYLQAIATNKCCGPCQEAALVAQEALAKIGAAPITDEQKAKAMGENW